MYFCERMTLFLQVKRAAAAAYFCPLAKLQPYSQPQGEKKNVKKMEVVTGTSAAFGRAVHKNLCAGPPSSESLAHFAREFRAKLWATRTRYHRETEQKGRKFMHVVVRNTYLLVCNSRESEELKTTSNIISSGAKKRTRKRQVPLLQEDTTPRERERG